MARPIRTERIAPDRTSSYAWFLPHRRIAATSAAVRRLRGWRQEFVAERMMYLGHQWSRQTVGEVEQGRRSGRGPVAGDAHRCGRPACHALRSRGHEVDMYVTWDDAERWRLSMVEFRDKGEEPR
jgi:hypothetical protein